MFNKSKIYIIPSKDKTLIGLDLGGKSIFIPEDKLVKTPVIYQHLYVTSDEDIKEGDWYYYIDKSGYKQIFNWAINCIDPTAKDGRKIIASTDPKLNLKASTGQTCPLGLTDSDAYIHNLPKIPKSFIENYCKLQGIDVVDVEYEVLSEIDDNPKYDEIVLKLNSDNEITIKEIKNSWSREELADGVLFKLMNDIYASNTYGDIPSFNLDDWIKNNL